MDHIAEKTGKGILSIKRPTTAHPLGGACIGRNTDEGVVDGKGEVFDHPGLYVADAAALPKPVEGPPSMTVAAWANHVGEQLIMKLRRENADSFGQPFLRLTVPSIASLPIPAIKVPCLSFFAIQLGS